MHRSNRPSDSNAGNMDAMEPIARFLRPSDAGLRGASHKQHSDHARSST